jgi:hypothetical protein
LEGLLFPLPLALCECGEHVAAAVAAAAVPVIGLDDLLPPLLAVLAHLLVMVRLQQPHQSFDIAMVALDKHCNMFAEAVDSGCILYVDLTVLLRMNEIPTNQAMKKISSGKKRVPHEIVVEKKNKDRTLRF